MIPLFFALLIAAGPEEFPEADDGLIEEPADIIEPSAPAKPRAPAAAPAFEVDAESEGDTGSDWSTKNVRPRDVTPSRAPAAPPRAAVPVAPSVPAQPAPRTAATPAPAPPAANTNVPFIAGYHDSLWGDTKDTVQRVYTSERPLVERGENKWMIQDKCEGEDAVVVYGFSAGVLTNITCQYKRGLEASTPDYALYRKVRAALAKFWGEPTATNESPAPDSPQQAAQWDGRAGKATLAYDADSSFVQLKVEKRP